MCLADILGNPREFSGTGDNAAALQTAKSTIPYRDVAAWRSDFFACLIYQSASSLRTESNTANWVPSGGVTLAVLSPPAPENVANWQTQFFSPRKSLRP
jgi:hypothetical protein